MNDLYKIAALYKLLGTMEADLGMSSLTQPQKSVLYAVELLSEGRAEVPLQDIMNHEIIAGLSRPTFFRSLKFLLEHKFISVNYYKGFSTYKVVRQYD